MLQREGLDPVDDLWRGRLRVALVDGRQVLQPLEALRLKPPLPLIEAGPVKAPLTVGLGDVAKFPGQFDDAHTALGNLVIRIPFPWRCRAR